MKHIALTIYMEPVPKGRPRATMKGGKMRIYTPSATVHAENIIRDTVMEKYPSKVEPANLVFEPGVPICLSATFYRSRPKSLKKSIELPVSRPDFDQYTKLLCDALEKFLYDNDSQITTALIKKRYGSPPRIELEMEEDNA